MTELVTEPAAMRAWSLTCVGAGRTIGFVPTMGALHDGHTALIEAARDRADAVVVSIFVNPLQFDQRADFDAYPRPVDDDVDRCSALGVDAVYAPTGAVMYPPGFDTRVVPGRLAERLEGSARPGHFDGVVTVVTKLLAAVRPELAVFGEKDFQQLALVRRLVADLDLGVRILSVPTVREPDGLALSSRNRRLDERQRDVARCVPRALAAVAQAVRDGATRADHAVAAGRAVLDAEPAASPEYLELVDAATFAPITDLGDAPQAGHVRVVAAVRIGDVRLIDNIDPVAPPTALAPDHVDRS